MRMFRARSLLSGVGLMLVAMALFSVMGALSLIHISEPTRH